eukprot:1519127-Pyramimonas_sp.AAC.1
MDVVQAFYRYIRELLLRSCFDGLSAACTVRAADLLPSAMHELARGLQTHGAQLARTGADAHGSRQEEQGWLIYDGTEVRVPGTAI